MSSWSADVSSSVSPAGMMRIDARHILFSFISQLLPLIIVVSRQSSTPLCVIPNPMFLIDAALFVDVQAFYSTWWLIASGFRSCHDSFTIGVGRCRWFLSASCLVILSRMPRDHL
jgi:hypothetical protein